MTNSLDCAGVLCMATPEQRVDFGAGMFPIDLTRDARLSAIRYTGYCLAILAFMAWLFYLGAQ